MPYFQGGFFFLLDNFLLDNFKVVRFAALQKLTYKYAQKHPQSMKNKQLKIYEKYRFCIQTQKQ